MRTKKARRSDPEIERAVIAAHAKGAPIEDLEYDEVTGLLDVVLAKTRAATEQSTAKVREVARKLDALSNDGPPTVPQRRFA